MAITYPLDMPTTPAPRLVNLIAVSATSVSRSVFTFSSQVHKHAGQIWGAEITLPLMARENAEEWTAFLLKLNGPYGTFRLGDPLAKSPRGSASGVLTIDGAGQSGQTVAITGLPASISGVFLAGDYIEIEERLYKVLVDANSDGSGDAVLDIWPRLRSSPINGAGVTYLNPTGLFRLTNSTVPIYSADESRLFELSFSAIEAI